MAFDVACVGLTILDILGRPVEQIPPGGGVDFIDEIRLTVAGTAAGTVIDCAKLGLKSRAVGAVGADEKGDFVVDTTGCGDAYCAGFIAGLAQGWEVEAACQLGTAASGLVATGLGSDAGIVDLDQTIALMETAEILE